MENSFTSSSLVHDIYRISFCKGSWLYFIKIFPPTITALPIYSSNRGLAWPLRGSFEVVHHIKKWCQHTPTNTPKGQSCMLEFHVVFSLWIKSRMISSVNTGSGYSGNNKHVTAVRGLKYWLWSEYKYHSYHRKCASSKQFVVTDPKQHHDLREVG